MCMYMCTHTHTQTYIYIYIYSKLKRRICLFSAIQFFSRTPECPWFVPLEVCLPQVGNPWAALMLEVADPTKRWDASVRLSAPHPKRLTAHVWSIFVSKEARNEFWLLWLVFISIPAACLKRLSNLIEIMPVSRRGVPHFWCNVTSVL